MRYVLFSVLAAVALSAAAQNDDDDDAYNDDDEVYEGGFYDDDPERCIFSSAIRRIEAIDDSTIAFYMGGSRVYVNLLPRRCPGLARYNRIAYETRGGRLCRMDRVSVIYSSIGVDTGLPCPLGDFHRMNRESVDIMIETQEQSGRNSPVSAEVVELPPLEEEAEQTEAGDDAETED